jgi:hypothetical protein
MLRDADRDRLIEATVNALDQVRSAYLGTPNVNVLRHWDQIGSRVWMAARTSTSAEEFLSCLARKLKLPPPDNYLSASMIELTSLVQALHATRDWLDLVEREHAHLMALTRVKAEARAAARKERR